MKRCSKCRVEKPRTEFFKDADKPDGVASACKSCRRQYARKYYERNRDRITERNAAYAADNHNAVVHRRRKWRAANRARLNEQARARLQDPLNRVKRAISSANTNSRRAGVIPCSATAEELIGTLVEQCQICGKPESELRMRLCLDHCHVTGEFRGWLCHNCNRALGLFGDSSAIVRVAARYLEGRNAA